MILNVLVETKMRCVYMWHSMVWPIYTLSRTCENYWLH